MSDKKTLSIDLPEGITAQMLKDNWDTAYREYWRAFRRVTLLDATDRGRLWEALQCVFPAYQVLPDTNHVNYVKANIVAGVYTVGKSARLLPTTPEDLPMIGQINIMLDHIWGLARVGYYQMLAGERAALTNLGVTQVGWDAELSGGNGDFFYRGGPTYKNIDPLKFMRDPYSADLDTSNYCMTWDVLHENILKSNPLYKDRMAQLAAVGTFSTTGTGVFAASKDRPSDAIAQSQRGYLKLIIHWVRIGDAYHEIHTIDNEHILHVKQNLQPAAFPFAPLYCNLPSGDLIGTSNPAKIFSNSVAVNITNSLLMTAEYKNQRPPRYVSATSGINLASFLKHGNEADYTFVVNGDASRAVHYQQFPVPNPQIQNTLIQLKQDMQMVTGIDGRYTGRDTGSIITTGGIESMLDQVTMIDAEKVKNYEDYCVRLTKLTLGNLIANSPAKRKYYVKVPKTNTFKTIEVDFPTLDKKQTVFNYEINISSDMPKNRARIAQTANILMEKQMQYQAQGAKVDFITPEEWLMCQDLPFQELMQERMGIQRTADYTEKVSKVLFTFAELTKQGVAPQDAIDLTAQSLMADETPTGEMVDIPQAVPEVPGATPPVPPDNNIMY
jgi:hypothetical protein